MQRNVEKRVLALTMLLAGGMALLSFNHVTGNDQPKATLQPRPELDHLPSFPGAEGNGSWVREHEPEVYARVTQVLLPKDAVRYHLTGAFATDRAGVGGTLLLDLYHA